MSIYYFITGTDTDAFELLNKKKTEKPIFSNSTANTSGAHTLQRLTRCRCIRRKRQRVVWRLTW